MPLPDSLLQQLGRLLEQGCPRPLVDRAMGLEFFVEIESGNAYYSDYVGILGIDFRVQRGAATVPLHVAFWAEGHVTVASSFGNIRIPAAR